jgi:hypothetical protein
VIYEAEPPFNEVDLNTDMTYIIMMWVASLDFTISFCICLTRLSSTQRDLERILITDLEAYHNVHLSESFDVNVLMTLEAPKMVTSHVTWSSPAWRASRTLISWILKLSTLTLLLIHQLQHQHQLSSYLSRWGRNGGKKGFGVWRERGERLEPDREESKDVYQRKVS